MVGDLLKINVLRFENPTKWEWFWGTVGLALNGLAWYNVYRLYKALKKCDEAKAARKLFWDRHNCVVMYSVDRGVLGWPNPSTPQRIDNIIESPLLRLYEPILYFINTATISIDIAIMLMDARKIIDALIQASTRRQVAIRIILDFEYSSRLNIRELEDAGIQVLLYVCPEGEVASIFHYKYMVKDYYNNKGFLYVGSLNWSASGIQSNYENTVYTSNPNTVQDFHRNFERSWEFIQGTNETNAYVRARLLHRI